MKAPPEKIDILTFRLGGVAFGMDMAGISGLEKLDAEIASKMNIPWFHDYFPGWRAGGAYECVHLLTLGRGDETRRVLIDQPQDVNVPAPVDQIRPLPALIERAAKDSPLWAAALLGDAVILLADLDLNLNRAAGRKAGRR